MSPDAGIDNCAVMTLVRAENRRGDSRKVHRTEGYRQVTVFVFMLPSGPKAWNHDNVTNVPGVRRLHSQIRSPGFFGIAVNVEGQERALFGKTVDVNGRVLSGENRTETENPRNGSHIQCPRRY